MTSRMKKKGEEEKTGLAAPTPAPLAAPGGAMGADAGFLDDDRDVLKVPIAKLLQALSPEVDSDDDDAKPGVLWDPVFSAPLTENFVPLVWSREWIDWIPKDEGGGIAARYTGDDLKADPDLKRRASWTGSGKDRKPPELHEHLNVLVLFEGRDLPIVLSWSTTGLQAGKDLYTLCKHRGAPVYRTVFKVDTVKKSNEKGSWYVLTPKPIGDPSKEEYARAQEMFNSIRGVGFAVDHGEAAVGEGDDGDGIPDHLKD